MYTKYSLETHVGNIEIIPLKFCRYNREIRIVKNTENILRLTKVNFKYPKPFTIKYYIITKSILCTK